MRLVASLAAAAAFSACVSAATAARAPTAAELRSLARAVNASAGVNVDGAWRGTISTASPQWALVRWNGSSGGGVELYHHGARRWEIEASTASAKAPLDGLCAYVPLVVLHDLVGIRACPPYRALHARPAGERERVELSDAFRLHAPSLANAPWRLVVPCISRLDARWAGGVIAWPDTGIVVWFHRSGSRWRVFSYGRLGDAALPPRRVILSLAACVRINAGEFGA